MAAAQATRQARALADITDMGASPRLRLYSGTPPANADAALSGNTVLSDHVCAATPATAVNGVITFNAIGNATAVAGTVTFARLFDNAGAVVKHQYASGNITIAGGNTLTAGQTVQVLSLVMTHPAT